MLPRALRLLTVLILAAATARADSLPSIGAAKLPAIKRGANTQVVGGFLEAPNRPHPCGLELQFARDVTPTTFDLALPTGTRSAFRYDAVTDVTYVITCAALDAKLDRDAALDGAVSSLVAASGGTLVGHARKIRIDGFPARSARIELANGAVWVGRYFATPDSIYGMVVGDVGGDDVGQRFADFRLHSDAVTLAAPRVRGAARLAGVTVTPNEPLVDGPLDHAVVGRYIRRTVDKMTRCYEEGLYAVRKLGGTLTAKLVIAENGSVTSSTAEGVDEEVAGCVAEMLARVEFPKPKGKQVSVRVSIAFHYAPR